MSDRAHPRETTGIYGNKWDTVGQAEDAPLNRSKLHIRTFGCQMNVHDARRMEDVLRPAGYRPTSDPAEADVILVNTCSVREKSRQKVLSALGRLGRVKARRPGVLLGVAGCVAQQDGATLLELAPQLDLVFSPDHIASLPELLERARRGPVVQVGFGEEDGFRFLAADAATPGRGVTALVTIQKGCDNHCAYCIVPLVRGPEVSRPAGEVVAEVAALVASGAKEITLIGQNVNSYRGISGVPGDFAALLDQVAAVPGLARLRFTTSHPKDFTEALAARFAALPRLCPWLHLPVQSGSSRVLAAMARGYDREHYLRCVELARRHCPEITVGTDLIVGFPGETDEDFEQTLELVRTIEYDYAFSFKYSPRPGTPSAASLPDDVPAEVKAARLARLQRLQDGISAARLGRLVGRTVPVLVEGPSRRGPPQLAGRSPGNHVVNIDPGTGGVGRAGVRSGDEVQVTITHAGKHSLTGVVSGSDQERAGP